MNSYNQKTNEKKYYAFEGGYITYNPKNLTERYLSSEYKNKIKNTL